MESEHSSKQVASISFLHLLLLKDCKLFQFGEGKKKIVYFGLLRRDNQIYTVYGKETDLL